jgi:perosamine synthetase
MTTHPPQPIAFSRPWLGSDEEAGAAAAIASGWIVGGPRQLEFETEFARLCAATHAIAVSSWTTGAFLVLHALGIGPGDEVIVPSLTFVASVNVIRHVGATPVFADIDLATYNIDPSDVERRLTSRTRLVVPVDQIGLPSDVDRITEIVTRHGGIKIFQDAACSFASTSRGRPVGSYADICCFSLHARKIVTTGEGGMIVTSDPDFAARLRRLRHQGMSLSDFERHGANPTTFESYPEIGYNFRLTDIQAGVGLAQLKRLDEILTRRRTIADRYFEGLKKVPWLVPPHVPAGLAPNWQSFQVRVRREAPVGRNELMDLLYRRGVPTRRGVMASHLELPYKGMGRDLPNTLVAAEQGLQLPMHPGLTEEQQAYIIDCLFEIGRPAQTIRAAAAPTARHHGVAREALRVPDFIIAGAPRSGTTWLYDVLNRHPAVYMANPRSPEPKFFLRDDLYARGLEYYRRYFERAGSDQVCGEKSTNYLESSQAAERIASSLPHVKLVFVLRDPVTRAWSNYLWSRMNGLETLSFADAMEKECERERSYAPEHRYSRPFSYLSRGLYTGLLVPYVRLFGIDRILVLRFEDIISDAGTFAAEVHRFLGVAERPKDAISLGAVNPSENRDGLSLPLALRRRLEGFYTEPNQKLQALLGRSSALWAYNA